MRFVLKITEIMKNLAEDRPIFHLEKDFQLALSMQIQTKQGVQVRPEHPFRDEEKKRKYLDIWIRNKKVAIELKYKTQRLIIRHKNEDFSLRNQSAQDEGRYDFLKDVERLEKIIDDGQAREGFAVLLTNDPLYWTSQGRDTTSFNFRLEKGRKIRKDEKMKWKFPRAIPKSMKKRRKSIILRSSYELEWRPYYSFRKVENGRFKYLAVKVTGQTQTP